MILKGQEFKVYDFYNGCYFDVIALENEKDEIVKVEFDFDHILYAEKYENDEGIKEFCIDAGDC